MNLYLYLFITHIAHVAFALGYHNHMIMRLAEHSSTAYTYAQTHPSSRLHDTTGIRSFIDDEHIIITSRGTISLTDWKCNLNFFLEMHPYPNSGMAHRGFLCNVWEYTKSPEFEILRRLIEKNNRCVFITGHSSGGAKAILIAHKLAHDYPHIKFTAVTFGSPKMADSNFYKDARKLENLEIISVNLKDDIVQLLGIGVNHADRCINITPSDSTWDFVECHQMIRYKTFINDSDSQLFDKYEMRPRIE